MRGRAFLGDALFLFFCCLIFVFIFRSIVFNLSSNLLDWNDYPYYVWTVDQVASKIINLKFDGFFNSNIFYPYEGSLLFSDLLIPQSVLYSLVNLFVLSKVAAFNIVFLLTFFLNTFGGFFLWRRLFKDRIQLYLAVFITTFSPFIFLSYNHFQIITIWPFLFGLGFLLKEKLDLKNSFLAGLFCAVQFLASVYISIFMLFTTGLWYLLKLIDFRNINGKATTLLWSAAIFTVTFLVVTSPFVYKYIQVKNAYSITRDYGEYVLYAAHPTDYLFTNHYHSLLSDTPIFDKWNSLNRHFIGEAGGFPGIILTILGIIGIFAYKREKQTVSINFSTSPKNIFFLIITIAGLLFSFGPRLSVNGAYTGIPLPYDVVMRIIPILEPVRATSRWMILFYLGLIYFAVLGLSKLIKSSNKQGLIVFGVAVLFFAEIAPINLKASASDYYPDVYKKVAVKCSESPKILLEYPMTQFRKGSNIVSNLSYRTQAMLASSSHKCILVNGYSGYIPKDFERYESEMFNAIEDKKADIFWGLILEKQVSLIKLNKEELYYDRVRRLESWIKSNNQVKVILDDQTYLIAEIPHLRP